MNNWIITHLFIICSICFHTGGLANPVKDSRTMLPLKCAVTNPGSPSFKNAGMTLPDHSADYGSGILFPHHGMRISSSVESYCLALPIFFVTISRRAPEEMNIKNKVEKVLKDYLRHLFPSHYFW